ncbi:MAG: molybdopterin-dependent oxidoreductase [Dongiaceae bacterium]
MDDGREIIRTTCPRDCYDACGIAVVKHGKKARVLGDPDHAVARGALCGKCAIGYNGAWRDPDQRLGQPLKRVGPKGSGKFEPISWDEAIETVARRLSAIADKTGPAAIWHAHYTGTCSQIAGGFPMRFFNRLGASEMEPDSICNLAGHLALGYMYGTSVRGFDPRTAKDAKCLIVWGANPHASAPHQHKHWLKETPATVVVVDPVRHATAAEADIHLQPFPGSDSALVYALLHVIRREGLLDRDYLDRHTIGWSEVESQLDECTPAWGEATTGVPAADIERVAKLYAEGPSMLWLGQGLQRQPFGGNVFRACGLLPPATGNLGKPGTGILFLNGSSDRGMDETYMTAPHLRQAPAKSLSHMDLCALLEKPVESQALVCWNINIAASNPDQARLHKLLKREDLFLVVLDLFRTDTADFADLVLPAASFLEFDDIVTSYFNLTVGAQAKAFEPVGEALPNQEIFRRLARAMGYNDPELFEDDRSIIDRLVANAGIEGGFDALKKVGTIYPSREPVIRFADGVFPTPSGKIEIASERAAADGLPAAPTPHADPRPAKGLYRLLTPATPWLMNSIYGNDEKIVEKNGPESIALHPDDAAALGLADGDMAIFETSIASLSIPVRIENVIPRGVALGGKSRWVRNSALRANINALNPGLRADMGDSTAVHGVEVSIRRA